MAGSIPPNPSELISSEKAIELINALKENYDIIILDTPPVGIISDAKLLMDIADVKLYTIRQNYTPRNAFRTNIIDLSSKIKSIGIILNDIKIQKGSGVYSYGYKYYTSKSKKKKININNKKLIKRQSRHG